MKHMLSAMLMVWTASAAAAECPNQATKWELHWMDRRLDGFKAGSYVLPERAADVLHDIRRIEKGVEPSCLPTLADRLEGARRKATDVLKASLEKDSFVLEGNFAILERKLDDLERRVAAAEAGGWLPASREALATEYAGYYQGQRSELLRMYIVLADAAFRAEEVDGRSWVEETTCEAGKALARVTPRVRSLEVKLRVGRDGREPTPRRYESGAGPIFGRRAFDGALPVFDGGSTFVTGGNHMDIRTPPPHIDIPPPHKPSGYSSPKPRGWMR